MANEKTSIAVTTTTRDELEVFRNYVEKKYPFLGDVTLNDALGFALRIADHSKLDDMMAQRVKG